MDEKVIISSKKYRDINYLEAVNGNDKKGKPLVVFLHGWSARKEYQIRSLYVLADRDFFVVAPDLPMHGERKNRDFEGSPEVILEIIQRTIQDVNSLFEYYKNDERVDVGHFGITGASLGGIISYIYISLNKNKLKAAVPLIAIPEFTKIVSFMDRDIIHNILRLREKPNMNALQKISDNFQQPKLEELCGVPILMLNGTEDPLIPINEVRKSYKKLKEICKGKSLVELIEYPNTGHTVNWEMSLEIANWFEKYL